MRGFYLNFLILLVTGFTGFGQNQVKINRSTLYDDWPVTVESNDLQSKGITTNFVPLGTTWDHRIITYFFQNGTDDIAANNERQAIRDAFALWSAHTDLYFLEVCAIADADMVFLWGFFNHGDTGPFDGENGVLAHTLGGPPPNSFGDQAGDIHFDESEAWTLANRSDGAQPIDLVTVAAHEIGHALGLNHTTVSGSLMLPSYTGTHRFLGSDDIAGIRSLYGQPQVNVPISGPGLICTNGTFSLQNQPVGTSTTWLSSNPSGLNINPNTGLATRMNNFNGQVSITATINSGCVSVIVTRNIWTGKPTITNGPWYGHCSEPEYTFTAPLIQNASYVWSINKPSLVLSFNNQTASVSGTGVYTSYQISVSVSSQGCTMSNTKSASYISQCNGPNGFGSSVFPNPTSSELTITMPLEESTNKEATITIISEELNTIYSEQTNSKELKIDVRGFKKGTYYLNIKMNDRTDQHRIIID